MIGRLRGTVAWKGVDQVLIDVGGVGYQVQVDPRTLAGLPGPGGAAVLWTELLVREDALTLVGFPTMAEREWHRLLMSVQGVGPRAALAMVGALGAEGLARAVALGDAATLRRAPGVGPKLAQRVALELKDRAPALMALGGAAAAGAGDAPAEPAAPLPAPTTAADRRPAPAAAARGAGAQAQAEALSALANLGYTPAEAAAAVAASAAEAGETAALIRAALRRLAPGDGR